MAIAYGEYGYYDTETGRTISNVGGENGPIWQAFTSDVTPPVSYGTGAAPVASQAAAVAPKGYQSDYVRWSGGAGQPVEYKRPDGTWVSGGAPEHAESAGYLQKAFADPQTDQLFKFAYEHPDQLNNEQKAFFSNLNLGLDSLGQGGRWGALNLFDDKFNPQQAGALLQTGGGGYLSDADKQAGSAFNFRESPAEQSKRAEADDGFLGLGDLGTLAMLAAAIYSGGSALGAWGAGAGATGAGGLAAADAMAGLIPAGELGAWTGAAGAGLGGLANAGYIDALGGMTDATGTALSGWGDIASTAATAGSGAMDFSNLGDLWDYGSPTEYAPQDVVDLFNNAGMPGYNNLGESYESLAAELFNNAGTPGFDQYGNEATGLDWIKSYLPSNISGPLKTLLGNSGKESSGDFNWSNALAGGLMQYLKMQQAEKAREAGNSALNNMQMRSAAYTAPLTPRGNLGTAASRLPTIGRGFASGGSFYAQGGTPGQSDQIPAMLSDGEYVIDAETVAALGDGNNAAGAAALEQMRRNVRKHKRAAPINKIPPKSKRPEQYMKGAR